MHSLPIEMRGAPPHAEGSQPEDFYFLWSESAQKSALVSAEEETSASVRVGDVEYTCGYCRTTTVRAPVGNR